MRAKLNSPSSCDIGPTVGHASVRPPSTPCSFASLSIQRRLCWSTLGPGARNHGYVDRSTAAVPFPRTDGVRCVLTECPYRWGSSQWADARQREARGWVPSAGHSDITVRAGSASCAPSLRSHDLGMIGMRPSLGTNVISLKYGASFTT